MTRSPATIVDAVAMHAAAGGKQTIGVSDVDATEVDYPTFHAMSRSCAATLAELGVRQGDPVGMDMATTLDTFVATLAVWQLGAILVPLRGVRRLPPSGHDFRLAVNALRTSAARWCVAPAELTSAYEAAAGDVSNRPRVVPLPVAARTESSQSPVPPAEVGPGDTAIVQFSSGSVGSPKGIVISHGNLMANMTGAARRIWIDHRSRGVGWLPLSHDMGLVAFFAISVATGAALRMMPPSSFVRDPLRWVEECSDFGATHTIGPPFGYQWVIALAELAGDRLRGSDLSSMRAAIVGAERVDPALCLAFERAMAPYGLAPNATLPAYGLAENTAGVALRPPLQPSTVITVGGRELIGHGRPIDGTTVRVVDSRGREVPNGVTGELQITGTSATGAILDAHGRRVAAANAAGLVPTGDVGLLVDGELFVVGRLKEIFKFGGITYAPADVETVVRVAGVPGLVDTAAVATQRAGDESESLLVFLEMVTPDREAAATVRTAVLDRLGLPVRHVFVAPPKALPRTKSGKVRRLELASAFLDGTLTTAYRVQSATDCAEMSILAGDAST